MPEDELVPSLYLCATRGLTLRRRPEDTWPWLAQMGTGPAGFYGYDLIENIGEGSSKLTGDADIVVGKRRNWLPG